jgi:hypothetical protein
MFDCGIFVMILGNVSKVLAVSSIIKAVALILDYIVPWEPEISLSHTC